MSKALLQHAFLNVFQQRLASCLEQHLLAGRRRRDWVSFVSSSPEISTKKCHGGTVHFWRKALVKHDYRGGSKHYEPIAGARVSPVHGKGSPDLPPEGE